MFHLKEQFSIQQHAYFKDDECMFCNKAIKKTKGKEKASVWKTQCSKRRDRKKCGTNS